MFVPSAGKYVGKGPVTCRSNYERAFCKYLETNPNVKRWTHEPFPIAYVSPADGDVHRYYIDFLVEFVGGEVVLIEIKPSSQTKAPKVPKTKRGHKRFMDEAVTYSVNEAKWEAARDFARAKGAEFVVLDEEAMRKIGVKMIKTYQFDRVRSGRLPLDPS